MIKNQKDFKSKSIYLLIVAVSMFTAIFPAHQQQIQAQEDCSDKRLFEKIGCGVDNAGQSIKDGERDGKRAGVNGESSACPVVGDAAYCTGWDLGYGDGRDARNDLNEVQNSDDGEFVENDDNDDN